MKCIKTSNGDVRAHFDGEQYWIRSTSRIEQNLQDRSTQNQSPVEETRTTTSKSDEVTLASSSRTIYIGSDSIIDTFSEDDKYKSGVTGGIAKKGVNTDLSAKKVGGIVQVAYLADATVRAEIYQNIDFTHYRKSSQLLKVEGAGNYRGTSSSALGGGSIEASLFLRDRYGGGNSTDVLDIDLGLVDGWGDADSYSDHFYHEVSTAGSYELGIRLEVSASSAGPASAIVDVNDDNDDNDFGEFPGYFDIGYFNLEWQ